ncbi:MAG: hypothetical protein IPM99_05175 [Rubrivivax sp.]|nr:hypothetical protein [Rubrivivax sp.]
MPTLYHDLLTHRGLGRHRHPPRAQAGFAGAPMHDALLKRLQAAFQPELVVTTASRRCTPSRSTSVQPDKPGSAGRAGLNTRLRVVKLDQRDLERLVAPMEEGQIIADLRSDEAFEGY